MENALGTVSREFEVIKVGNIFELVLPVWSTRYIKKYKGKKRSKHDNNDNTKDPLSFGSIYKLL